jgi:hypothetical protein
MKIQPMDTSQQTNFCALKVNRLNVKPRISKQLTHEQEQSRNYLQAIGLALAFVAASFTKYFVDLFQTKHKEPIAVETTAKPSQTTDTNTFQLR